MKQSKGVTLIALVITIIVLLILAGVSIAMLTGDNGLLTKAENAKTQTEIAGIKERVKTDILGEQAGNKTADISKTQLKTILDKYFTDVPDDYTLETEITAKAEYGSYKMKVSDLYDGTFGGEDVPQVPEFDENTFTLGTSASDAKNTNKYGSKVTNYNVEEAETGGWRLFYQDNNYTYLISDNCIGNYKPSEQYSNYASGADVSTIGKKLNPMINSLFTSSNKNSNIRATAWLTDTSKWSKYTNGDAVFAIGSPTIELFTASFNNRNNKSTKVELSANTIGYNTPTLPSLLNVDDNEGIYNKNSSTTWWIASPNQLWDENYECYIMSDSIFQENVTGISSAIRPVVCIPTSVFNSKYKLDDYTC